MAPLFSLAQLTVLALAPPDIVATAARTGYHGCGMRLLPVSQGGTAYRLMDDPAMLRETLAHLRDTGVAVSDLEIVRLGDSFDVADYTAFFEVGQQLGALNILVAGDDCDEARLTANFATLCEAARPYGLTADLEFMPWTAVRNLRSAQRIVAAAGQDNGGVLVDSLHFARSDSRLDELEQLPRAALHYAQICDAPGLVPSTDAGLIHTARAERLLPGEGGIDLASIFARLPAGLPISVEIPNEARCAALGPEAWASAALDSAKVLMARVAAGNQAS
jgi:sugar phosphate isomerase/epimerase